MKRMEREKEKKDLLQVLHFYDFHKNYRISADMHVYMFVQMFSLHSKLGNGKIKKVNKWV